jgi:hypothetical protein
MELDGDTHFAMINVQHCVSCSGPLTRHAELELKNDVTAHSAHSGSTCVVWYARRFQALFQALVYY